MSNNEDLMDEVKKILFDAAVSATQDRLKLEMEDFKEIEKELLSQGGDLLEGTTEVWAMVLPEEQPDNGTMMGMKHIGTYPDPYIALTDEEMIHGCKEDGSVGIIIRCEGWASASATDTGVRPSESNDRTTTEITCLCTSAGVHVIARFGNEVHEMSESKAESFRSDNRLTRAIATACYNW
jgi:hypothetical protein